MLELRGLKKSFGQLEVLKGIDLQVDKGDVVAILGRSGSGKTTLLRCLNFLEKSDAGTLSFDGESFDMARIGKKDIARLRAKTAFVFQNYNLFLNKTALQNVTEGLVIARKMPKDRAVEIGRRMLERVGLSDRESYYPSQLSGGQQQRIAIARALCAQTKIILFDEPTSALDPETIQEVLDVMIRLGREKSITMVVVTHEMGFARQVADRVVFMADGQIIESGTPEHFFTNPQNERVKQFLGKIIR